MLENSYCIVVGVAAGMLTAFLASFVNEIWFDMLLPLLRRWFYRGPNVSGEWKGLGTGYTPASGEWSEVGLTLKQDTSELRGTIVLRDRSAGHSIDLNLRAEGATSRGYVSLSLWPATKASTSVGTALLKVEDDGAALNGHLLYRNARDTIDVVNVSVHRAASIAAPRLLPSAATRA